MNPPPLPLTPVRRFPIGLYLLVLAVILAIALAPVVSVVLSSWLAQAHGCVLNEGNSHPCMIGGKDWGETLYSMFVLGWLMLLSLPAGALAFLLWLGFLIAHLVKRNRAARVIG